MLALSPGVAEAAADASHWVVEGHTLHAKATEHEAHEEHAGHAEHEKQHGDDEHGCTALFHLCGCHSPTPSVTSTPVLVSREAQLQDERATLAPEETRRPGDGVCGETFRPPIA